MTLKECLQKFIDEKNSINLSEKTLATYTSHISGFICFAEGHNKRKLRSACTEKMYYDYIAYLGEDKKIRDISVASNARSIKAWFYWMMEQNLILHAQLKIPKYQETIPETYSDNELSVLLQRPKDGCTETRYITWVMINVLIATGARLGSLREIKVKDFSYNELKLAINTTKNNIAIELPINIELAMILIEYINYFHLEPENYLFSSAKGNKYASRTIEDFIAHYIYSFGFDKSRKVHAFRHTFAKKYYLETHDVYKLKEILGHQSLAMTEHYVKSLGCALFETIEYNPQREHIIEVDRNQRQRRRGTVMLNDNQEAEDLIKWLPF